ncbi:hypothetical protein HA402_003912 [Bradysia odoriphaga]|nr:hypothetical protein HA402_003912 [Bradysia odoriphaga]
MTTTSIAQKIKERNTARQLRFGSPKLRDHLRQKCRSRIKESRVTSFDNNRAFENDFLSRIVKDELREMDIDIELQAQFYAEIEQEILQWTIEEFERENDYLFNDGPTFFCPFCQKSELNFHSAEVDQMVCQRCGIQFKCLGTPDQFHELLQRRLVQHELICVENLNFFVEPIAPNAAVQGLNAICMECDFYSKLY